jgi:hypothetical protein
VGFNMLGMLCVWKSLRGLRRCFGDGGYGVVVCCDDTAGVCLRGDVSQL